MKKILMWLVIINVTLAGAQTTTVYIEKFIIENTKYYTDIKKTIVLGELEKGEKVTIMKEINEKYYYIKTMNGRQGYIDKSSAGDEAIVNTEFLIEIEAPLNVYVSKDDTEPFDIVKQGEKYNIVRTTKLKKGKKVLETTEGILIEDVEANYKIANQ